MTSVQPSSSKRSVYQKFLRPSWLAGAISVGFHGVLFAAGPTFPSLGFNELVEPELEAERRNVPLVELSQAEQARLPDFSQPFYNFNAFDDLEPLSPLFNNESPQTPDEDDTTTEVVPSPLTRSLPIPTHTSRIPFGITRLEPRPRATLPSLPQPDTEDPSNSPDINAGTSGSTSESAQEGTAADLEQTPTNPDQPATTGGTDIAASGDPTEVMTLEERLQAYTYDVTDTELEEAQTRFDDWLVVGQTLAEELEIEEDFAIADSLRPSVSAPDTMPAEASPDSETPEGETTNEVPSSSEVSANSIVREPIELPIDYEQGVCLTKEPQKGLIGAWVSPEGKLLGEPEVIRSTGYLGLNQQAIRYIKGLDFSAVDSFTGYQFEVVVNYNSEGCVNIGRPPAMGDRPTPTSTELDNADNTDQESSKDEEGGNSLPFDSLRPLEADNTDASEEEATPPVNTPSSEAEEPTEDAPSD